MSKIRAACTWLRTNTKKAKPLAGPVVSGGVSGLVRWALENLFG